MHIGNWLLCSSRSSQERYTFFAALLLLRVFATARTIRGNIPLSLLLLLAAARAMRDSVWSIVNGGFLLACVLPRLTGASAIFLLNRPSERARKARASLAELAAEAGKGSVTTTAVIAVDCDLQSFESVRAAASNVCEAIDAGGFGGKSRTPQIDSS